MLTKMWYRMFNNHLTRGVITNGLVDITGAVSNLGCYKTGQSDVLLLCVNGSPLSPPLISTTASTSGPALVFGSGTTPATINDYKLENQITTGFTASRLYADGVIRITITNTSGADLIIGEVGVYCFAYTTALSTSAAATGRKTVMLERTVLASPVTIHAGEAGVIDYKLTVSIPD